MSHSHTLSVRMVVNDMCLPVTPHPGHTSCPACTGIGSDTVIMKLLSHSSYVFSGLESWVGLSCSFT